MMTEIWVGDYSVLVWIPEKATQEEKKTIIRNTFAISLAPYGLKVVNA